MSAHVNSAGVDRMLTTCEPFAALLSHPPYEVDVTILVLQMRK